MQCKSCGGPLAARHIRDYLVDENGVSCFTGTDWDYMQVVCLSCGAQHAHEVIHKSGDQHTIALEANSDPEPVATVAIYFQKGHLIGIRADRWVGLLIIDEDRQEIGRFNTHPDEGNWEAVKKLEALIPKGEHKASFKEVEDDDTEAN